MKVNENLIKEFNLPPLEDDEEIEELEESEITALQGPTTLTHLEKIDKINEALPQVSGLDATDQEFDELANYGLEAHKDLMELAISVEQRFAADVASAAASMLANAITAKTNKAKKKLDMISLQIKKQLADLKEKQAKSDEEPEILEGESVPMDRTELLNMLLKKSESK